MKMEERDTFEQEVELWKRRLEEIYEKELRVLEEKTEYSTEILGTPEFLKELFSECLSRDLDFFQEVNGLKETRYASILVRMMLEQVIEFLYLMQDTKRIQGQYFNLKDSSDSIFERETDPMINLKNVVHILGKGRYPNERKNIYEMTKEIGEVGKEMLCLYNIYVYLSEKTHNAYFFQ